MPPPACECGFTQSVCLKLLLLLLLSLIGVEVFFGNSAEFMNPAVLSWSPLSHLAWSCLGSKSLRASSLPFCNGMLIVKSYVYLKW